MSTRLEIRDDFRSENPEITDRVITDATLNVWMKKANKEVCAETLCIVANVPANFDSIVGVQYYDMEDKVDNFFAVDDGPGGGVYYDGDSIDRSSPNQMNQRKRGWRGDDDGTPRYWWMRGKYLWFDVAPDEVADVDVDCALIPDDFDGDSKQPFNELGHLQAYCDGINKYMQWRAKQKVGKPEEAMIAQKAYQDYVVWMRKKVRSDKAAAIQMRPPTYPVND